MLQRGVLKGLHAACIHHLCRNMLLLLLVMLLLGMALLKLLLYLHNRLCTPILQGCRHWPAALHCVDSMLLLLLLMLLLMQVHCVLGCRCLVTGLLLLPLGNR